jgi:hypothetical protein
MGEIKQTLFSGLGFVALSREVDWVSGAARQQVTFFCFAKRRVTKEKATPLPRPFGVNLALPKKSGGRPNLAYGLRQVRPTSPNFSGIM